MELSDTQTEDIPAAFDGIKSQLNSILESNQLFQDYALLNGFLAFVHSKLNGIVVSSIESEYAFHLSKNSRVVDPVSLENGKVLSIIDFSWENVHYPIFKWFQMWRNYILFKKENQKQQARFIEFRKMNSKMLKFFKTVQNFYFNIINTIYKRYDISVLLPNKIVQDLKLADIKRDINVELNTFDNGCPFARLIQVIFHRCVLFLGTAHRYKSLIEELSNKYPTSTFKKSLSYFHLASLILPGAGETYSQAGMVFLQTGNLGPAMYEFVKGMMTKMPSPVSIKNFHSIMVDNKSSLNRNLHATIMNTYLQESKGWKSPNKEILEFYYLGLLGSVWSPNSWRDDTKSNQLNNGIKLKHLEAVLYETMSTRYLKNVQTIFKNLIITIGGFHLLLKRRPDADINGLQDLRTNELDYLKFVFRFIGHILNDIVKESWSENVEVPEILGMVRVINCWIKSNPIVLQYCETDIEFVNSLAYLVNDIMKNKPSLSFNITGRHPKRTYWFEEDLMVKGLSFMNFQLSDFEDYEEIIHMDSKFDRLIGDPPLCDKEPASSEMLLRLQAIVNSSYKLLAENKCGVEWSDDKSRYIFNKKIGFRENVKSNTRSPKELIERTKSRTKTKTSVTNGSISMADLERQMRNSSLNPSTPIMGYSGSSVPMAPDTFDVKPSGIITGNKMISNMLEIEVSDQRPDETVANLSADYNSAATSSSISTPASGSSFNLNSIISSVQTEHLEKSFVESMQGLNEQTPINDIYHQQQVQSSTQRHVYQQPPAMSSINSSYPSPMMPSSASVSYPYNFLNQQSQGVALPFNAHDSQWQNEICALNSRNFLNPTWMGSQNQSAASPVYTQPQQQLFQQPMQQEPGKYVQFPYGPQDTTGTMKGSGHNDVF
ncbi:Ebs1p [Saccharomyces eubayanus]|uniref:Ebs1p n=1 Tax=Saccharomyces eubayanus TaxID=1080349 RepID=UPI0006BED2ED|nr:EBS1-like protein [Saccharomyces eubayanus]KOH01045.1 EBS1-like protein [Saccharomyces eubayanus]